MNAFKTIFTLVILFLMTASACLAASPGEIDRRHKSSITFDDYKRLQPLIENDAVFSDKEDERSWRLARLNYSLGTRSGSKTKIKFFRRCVEHAEKAIQINGKSAYAYFFRGLCLGKEGQVGGIWKSLGIIDPLKKDMQKAIGLDASVEYGGPHRALGMLYMELPFFLGGNLEKSIHHLEEAVRLGPGYIENHFDLARAYYEDAQYDSARTSLAHLFQLVGTDSDDEKLQKFRHQANELMNQIKAESNS
jgi:tetratricopeptide (TPR) repeat protein